MNFTKSNALRERFHKLGYRLGRAGLDLQSRYALLPPNLAQPVLP